MDNILAYLPAMKPKGPHEFAGACPLCGGATNDGFIVWPDRPRGGAFLCRKCGASGDGIAFLMQRDGLTYREACEALGIEPKRTATRSFPARRTHARPRPARPAQVAYVPPKPEPAVLPCAEWMSSAAAFLADCQHSIEENPEKLLAITGRFLTPYTAQDCGIGWNPADRFVSRRAWGLADVTDRDGKTHSKLLLPRGIVIGTQRDGKIVSMAVRCPDCRPEGRDKYHQVKGGANVPYVAGRAGLPVVLVESALDAALLWQESFNTVCGVALMGSTKGLDSDTHAFIQAAPILLACPDNDAGGLSAWQRWSAAYPRAILTPAVGAKDLGDMHRAALAWPLDYSIPTTGEWLTAVLSAIPTKTGQTGPMSHKNTQPEHCAMPGMTEAA